MKLTEILKQYGLPVDEIKSRFNKKQILVNGESVDSNYSIKDLGKVIDFGFFFNNLSKLPFYNKYIKQIEYLGIENLMGGESNIENDMTNYLKEFLIVKISKSNSLIIKKGEINKSFILQKEGEGERLIKVEDKKVNQTELLLKRKEKLEKQLSNQKFLKNAPEFKIKEAKSKLEVIISKLEN